MFNSERECCFKCAGCQRVHCAQADASPGEASSLCPTCWMAEDPNDDRLREALMGWGA